MRWPDSPELNISGERTKPTAFCRVADLFQAIYDIVKALFETLYNGLKEAVLSYH